MRRIHVQFVSAEPVSHVPIFFNKRRKALQTPRVINEVRRWSPRGIFVSGIFVPPDLSSVFRIRCRWKGGSQVPSLKGKSLEVAFRLRIAKVFAYRVE